MPRKTRNIELTQVTQWEDGKTARVEDYLAAEEPLEMRAGKYSLGVTLRTPGDDKELVAGFLFTEGIISRHQDIVSMKMPGDISPQRNLVRVTLNPKVRLAPGSAARRFSAGSACGVCGKASIAQLRRRGLRHPERITLFDPEVLCQLPEKLRAAQPAFGRTGGLHAAALFDARGELKVLREDIGRHNAVDKVIGWALLEGPTSPLPATHEISLYANSATDLTGNTMNGFGVTFFVCSTSDTVPPTVIATNPGGTVNPPTNSVIQALFNKSVQATSLSNVTLTASGPIAITTSLSNGDQTLTITPGAPLSPSKTYTVTLTGVNSTAGVAMASPVVFSFTTAGGAQLSGTAALSTVPASGATGVAKSIKPTVTFSAPIDPATAYGNIVLQLSSTSAIVPSTLSFSADFKTVTITPNSALSSTTAYQINSLFNTYVTDQTGSNESPYVINSFTTGP